MKRPIIACLSIIIACVSMYAQNDVTKFLGIPVDGPKSEFINNLIAKGFTIKTTGNIETLNGRFNGNDVDIFISTDHGLVSRVMVCNQNFVNETDIKIQFNRLCNQFENNGKYLSLNNFTIPEEEDISYEMIVHNKRYEANFYQLPEGDELEKLHMSIWQNIQSKYSPEQLDSASDELRAQITTEYASELFEAVKNKTVWFIICEDYGEYYIPIYYDNELNRAHGEDL